MELRVRYTDTFEITFKAVVAFIEGNWGEKVAKDFVKQAEKVISNITVFPYMYKATHFDESIRIAQVKKAKYPLLPSH